MVSAAVLFPPLVIRIFNSAFNELLDEKHSKRDFFPEPLRKDIDEINSWVYDHFNNGVYKLALRRNKSVYISNYPSFSQYYL